MLLSPELKTVPELCSVFDVSFPDDYLTGRNILLWFLFFMFSESKFLATLHACLQT